MIPKNPLVEEDDPFIWGVAVYMVVGGFVWLIAVGVYYATKALVAQPWMYIRYAGWLVGTCILLATAGALTVHTVRVVWATWCSGDSDERGDPA